ncbi:hypothetical protein D3C86_1998800 [compost metagenome]
MLCVAIAQAPAVRLGLEARRAYRGQGELPVATSVAVDAVDAQQRLILAVGTGRAGADPGQQLLVQVELPGVEVVDFEHVGGFEGFDQAAVGCAHGLTR